MVSLFEHYVNLVSIHDKNIYHEENIMSLMYENNINFFTMCPFDIWNHDKTNEPDAKSFYEIIEELNGIKPIYIKEEIIETIDDITSNLTIKYGIRKKKIDITHKCLKLEKNNIINISSGGSIRDNLFNDPVPGVHKKIFVYINKIMTEYDEYTNIEINTLLETIQIIKNEPISHISTVYVNHNAGFFSCCSMKLYSLIGFFNNNKELPQFVNSSDLFQWYKIQSGDITYNYFKQYDNGNDIVYNNSINYHHDDQFKNYHNLNYSEIIPFIKKYFSPSIDIEQIIQKIEIKYNLDYNNLAVLFYRGNDKHRETKLCEYDEYVTYAQEIKKINPKIKFLIQSDETEFINAFTNMFPNSFYFKDEIRHIPKKNDTVDSNKINIELFSKQYLAITIIMAKCKFIVCGTGNCSIWIMFYRENTNNVYQNKDGIWIKPLI